MSEKRPDDFSLARKLLSGIGGGSKKSEKKKEEEERPAGDGDALSKLVEAMKRGSPSQAVEPPGYGYLIETQSGKTIGPRSMEEPVRALQVALRRAKVDVPESGYYDDATQQAVRKFQQANGVLASGIFDGDTFEKLHAALGLDQPAAGEAASLAPRSAADRAPPLPPSGNPFIDGLAPGAVRGMHESGMPASVSIAMAIVESDWGQRLLARDYHNLFAVKGEGPAGSVMMNEQTGQPGGTTPFRRYDDDAQSVADHAKLFAAAAAYKSVMSHKDRPDNFVRALAGAYSDDPKYPGLLQRIMKQFDLYRFDRVSAPPPPESD